MTYNHLMSFDHEELLHIARYMETIERDFLEQEGIENSMGDEFPAIRLAIRGVYREMGNKEGVA